MEKQVTILAKSEGEMQRMVKEAQGRAQEITTIAQATADSIRKISSALTTKGDEEAYKLNQKASLRELPFYISR